MTIIPPPPPPPPIQLGGRKVLKEEVNLRFRAGNWKGYLFWALAIIAFIVFLSLAY